MIFENIFYVIFCLAILKPCYSAQVAAPLEAFKDKVLPIAPTTLTRPRYQNLAFSIAILYNFPHIRRYIMEKADDVGLNFYLAHCFYLLEAGNSLGSYHLDKVGNYLKRTFLFKYFIKNVIAKINRICNKIFRDIIFCWAS